MRRCLYLAVILAFFIASVSPNQAFGRSRKAPKAKKETPQQTLATLLSWMTGYFSSAQQAQKDSDYFDIRLRLVQIWKERNDGYWLYVEQATAGSEDKPYRQRVYNIRVRDDSTFESVVYSIPEPLRFAGKWAEEAPLGHLTVDSLLLRDGCAVVLRKVGSIAFTGGTEGTGCTSDLKGAAYATSEVTISKNQIISWDRGYDADNRQVWGARKGGYVFKRLE